MTLTQWLEGGGTVLLGVVMLVVAKYFAISDLSAPGTAVIILGVGYLGGNVRATAKQQ